MTGALRALAIAIALAGLVDPQTSVVRTRPIPVDLRAGPSPSDPDGTEAARVRQALIGRMGDAIESGGSRPRAVVTIGGLTGRRDVSDDVPVSIVSVEPRGRNVQIVDARATSVVAAGQRAVVSVRLHATAARGETSIVVLERDGLEVARATRAWNADDERGTVTLTYAPADAGLVPLRAHALPVNGEASSADNVSDVGLRVVSRPFRVLTWDLRPSWSAAFVRRALEDDPAFQVSSVTHSSRGIDTRSGTPPAVLTARALAPFDVAIVGAPEELSRRDVETLDAFVRDRGGVAVFVPDRAPSGAYRALLPPARFDELLLDRPSTLAAAGGAGFQASEFAAPSGEQADGEAIASMTEAGKVRPVVVSWPRGAGLVVFSGALDAWRFRGAAGDPFAKFWTSAVASLALQSPPPLSASVEPSFAAPGDRLTIHARYRAAELVQAGGVTRVPGVGAEVVSADGHTTPVRLWPGSVTGEYEGTFEAPPAAGRFEVRVSGSGGMVAEVPLVISAGARSRRLAPAPGWLSSATGGVAAHADDTAPIEAFLRGLPRPPAPVEVHPMRSAWWILPFAGALCLEWGLRRRNGLR